MTKLAETLGRVMMTAVSLTRTRNPKHADIQKWVETEYRNDPNYAYYCLMHGIKPSWR
jgi:hypothetical protein